MTSRYTLCCDVSILQDMEIVIHSRSLETPGLPVLLHAALRTLIDDFGAVTFNVGVLNNKQVMHQVPTYHAITNQHQC